MSDAARLSRNGRLADAAGVLQRALGNLPGTQAMKRAGAGAAEVLDGLVREVREPARPAARPAPGPAGRSAPGTGQFRAGNWTGDAGTRDYKLFIPSAAAQAGAGTLPLVVMLHGCTQNPDDFAAGTRMNEAAERDGFLVLYPAQAPRSNSSKCWNWFQPGDQRRGAGEPAVLAAMTRFVIETQPVDPERVHVAGLSAGGAMAAILGREYLEIFASVGVHSGLPQGAAHDVASAFTVMRSGQSQPAPAGGAPVIVFHGDQDGTVHPANGEHVVGRLAEGLAEERQKGSEGRAFTRSVWRDRQGRVAAEHWRIHGAGHAWSGGDPAGSYTDAAGPDASREMLRFFNEHPGRRKR